MPLQHLIPAPHIHDRSHVRRDQGGHFSGSPVEFGIVKSSHTVLVLHPGCKAIADRPVKTDVQMPAVKKMSVLLQTKGCQPVPELRKCPGIRNHYNDVIRIFRRGMIDRIDRLYGSPGGKPVFLNLGIIIQKIFYSLRACQCQKFSRPSAGGHRYHFFHNSAST